MVAYHGFDPYGNPVQSGGSPYGYTGEWWEADAGLLHLRARWYAPGTGTFLSRDAWPGDVRRGQSLNGWSYVEGNPINWVDPSGLYSSSPIHRMIQIDYEAHYALGIFVPEFRVTGGSKTGLLLGKDIMQNPILTGTPTGNDGFVDIVDADGFAKIGNAYEIKRHDEQIQAKAEIRWYIERYNSEPDPFGIVTRLTYGNNRLYPRGWTIIGINPFSFGSQYLLVKLAEPGVILYKGQRIDDPNIPPLPENRKIWEYNHATREVEGKQLTKVLAYCETPSTDRIGETIVVAGGTGLVIYGLWKVGKAAVGFVVAGPPGAAVGLATP